MCMSAPQTGVSACQFTRQTGDVESPIQARSSPSMSWPKGPSTHSVDDLRRKRRGTTGSPGKRTTPKSMSGGQNRDLVDGLRARSVSDESTSPVGGDAICGPSIGVVSRANVAGKLTSPRAMVLPTLALAVGQAGASVQTSSTEWNSSAAGASSGSSSSEPPEGAPRPRTCQPTPEGVGRCTVPPTVLRLGASLELGVRLVALLRFLCWMGFGALAADLALRFGRRAGAFALRAGALVALVALAALAALAVLAALAALAALVAFADFGVFAAFVVVAACAAAAAFVAAAVVAAVFASSAAAGASAWCVAAAAPGVCTATPVGAGIARRRAENRTRARRRGFGFLTRSRTWIIQRHTVEHAHDHRCKVNPACDSREAVAPCNTHNRTGVRCLAALAAGCTIHADHVMFSGRVLSRTHRHTVTPEAQHQVH